METGTVVSIDCHGHMRLQLPQRIVHAEIMTGGANIGESIEGYMQPGVRIWMNLSHRSMIVNVISMSDQAPESRYCGLRRLGKQGSKHRSA